MDEAGSGQYPLAAQDLSDVSHYTSNSMDHNHSVDLPATGVLNKGTTTVSNVPLYYGLLKIMRIK